MTGMADMQGIPFSDLEGLASYLEGLSDDRWQRASGYDELTPSGRIGKAQFSGQSRGLGEAARELRNFMAARAPLPDIPVTTWGDMIRCIHCNAIGTIGRPLLPRAGGGWKCSDADACRERSRALALAAGREVKP